MEIKKYKILAMKRWIVSFRPEKHYRIIKVWYKVKGDKKNYFGLININDFDLSRLDEQITKHYAQVLERYKGTKIKNPPKLKCINIKVKPMEEW